VSLTVPAIALVCADAAIGSSAHSAATKPMRANVRMPLPPREFQKKSNLFCSTRAGKQFSLSAFFAGICLACDGEFKNSYLADRFGKCRRRPTDLPTGR